MKADKKPLNQTRQTRSKVAVSKATQSAKSQTVEARKTSKPQACTNKTPQRKFLEEAECDGQTYRVGDSAYIILEPGEYDLDEEVEPCEICGKVLKRAGRKAVPLLECDKCLRGFHLDCLQPPLSKVPEEDWVCADCLAGPSSPPAPKAPRTARERFVAGQWSLVRIEALWQEAEGTTWFAGRWYYRPEETHTGRQEHHGAREVFLTNLVDNNELECLQRVVPVCHAEELAAFDGVNDVCVCEYEYDVSFQRFLRRAVEQAETADGPAFEDEASSDDDSDPAYKPVYALWAERGAPAASQARKDRAASSNKPTRKRKLQGGEQWTLFPESQLATLGLSSVPEMRRPENTELSKAQSALATTVAPKTLPCRDAERQQVLKFVLDAVQCKESGQSNCLYISGVPGTGKTATVLEVIRSMRAEGVSPRQPAFQFVEINSLRLPSPQHLYTHLLEAMTGQQYSPGTALARLEELFSSGGRPGRGNGMTIVLADEMDLLVTKKHEVLYNLFEWPMRKGSRLAVIGIANTMDLPERFLPRIASRLSGSRIVFQPYTRQQLATIVTAKLEEHGLKHTIAANAIGHACSKVAGVSGDLRRVLHLCRKACEVCEGEGLPQVVMRHVNTAVEEMFSAVHMQMLDDCCRLEKILLAALLLQMRITGRADGVLQDVAGRARQLVAGHSDGAIEFGDCLHAATSLASLGLLLVEDGHHRLGMRLSLSVSHDDVVYSLRSDANTPWLRDIVF